MAYFKGILVLNRSTFAKIAPEGGEHFWGRFFWIFGKAIKKHCADSSRIPDAANSYGKGTCPNYVTHLPTYLGRGLA